MKISRLRQQGFVNHHRKTLFRLATIGLVAYLFYVPGLWKIPRNLELALEFAGPLLILAGLLVRVLATLTIGGHKDRRLARTEIYSTCRNPLYFGSFVMALGLGMISGRPDFVGITAAAYLAIFYPMMINEARFLRGRFPEFAEYERTVPMFFPNPLLWHERDGFEINFRLVRKTFLDAAVAIAVIPLIMGIRWAKGGL